MPTVSQAKNIMRRTLSEIVDPCLTPALEDALWRHFDASCAYCAVHIDRASRTGHLDHLESGGGNGPMNRVLACARCNGDEKRDQPWRAFLQEKCPDDVERRRRIERIEAWVTQHPAHDPAMDPAVKAALLDAEHIIDEFHAACTRLREAVKKSV
ncbi:MAG: hypothetical protein B6A08_04510 [Sorangiineae bacterium NIC37A_2]|nr:MAG: hypothetical protein B6A08_04510 [Sorangiineae bacterium NIC37A_2]